MLELCLANRTACGPASFGCSKALLSGVNKMDCDTADYKQSRYDEIAIAMKKDIVEKNTPMMPISGWMGGSLLKKSANMDWRKDTVCAMSIVMVL